MTVSVAKLTAELAEAHATIADLKKALGLNDDNLGAVFKLSKAPCDLLGCLLRVPNVTNEMITLRLMIASDAKVAVHRLREVLKAFSDEHDIKPALKVQSKRGLGYWLDDVTKARILELTGMAPTQAPAEVADATEVSAVAA